MDGTHQQTLEISPRRILIIKLSSLGDIIHTLPAVSALRQHFPIAHISWLVKAQWAPILEGNHDINEVLCLEKNWRRLPTFIQHLRMKPYDLAVDFQGLFRTGIFGVLSGAFTRIGFSQAREGATWMYTHRVNLPGDTTVSWRLLPIHAVDRNLAIAAFLGADSSQPFFQFPALAEDRVCISHWLESMPDPERAKFIALAPWSRSALKSWPLDRFVQVAKELVKRKNLRVVLLGGATDKQKAVEFRGLEGEGLINLVGKLSIRQVPELLRQMHLIVGNDSALIHLAAGVGTKVLAIFGPTDPRATGPYPLSQHLVCRTDLPCSPCGRRACHNPLYLECLRSISVRSLVETIQEILAAPQQPCSGNS